jgi:S-sulfo-L-cysteine synthase (O-acetyl-L-serine-dependent)
MLSALPLYNEQTKIKIGSTLWDAVGNTPLIKIERITSQLMADVEIFAKAEWQNPGGSVKDRAVKNIILEGERSGLLTKDKIILDASSGNSALAYAMIAAAKGYQLILCVPENVSSDLIKRLKIYGAKVHLTSAFKATDGAIRKANQIYHLNPEKYFYHSQYDNPANWRAHYYGTGVEIWQQTQGEVTHLVAGMGTSGTLMGTGRRLRDYNKDIKLFGVQPDMSPHGIDGLKHLKSNIIPKIYDSEIIDGDIEVSTDEAKIFTRRLAKEEGLFVGISSGAALAASFKLAKELSYGRIVTIFPDAGTRYINQSFWKDDK